MAEHHLTVRTYSDGALEGIVLQLSRSGDWPQRLKAARDELKRRRGNLRR